MKISDFEQLMESVIQAGRIRRREMEPARKFEVRVEDVKVVSENATRPSKAS